MKKLIKFCIENTFLVNLFMVFICIAGFMTMMNMKRDLVPQFEFQMIQVTATLPGASPQEIEEFVTYPVEEVLKGIPGVEKMTSKSTNGQMKLSLYFPAAFDQIEATLDSIKSKLSSARPRLPDYIKNLDATRVRQDKVFLFYLAFENFDEGNVQHRGYIHRFEKMVSKIPGVVEVNAQMRPRDLHIEFDAEKIEAYDLSILELRQLISQSFRLIPLGQLSSNEKTLSFEIEQAGRSPDVLKNLPIIGNRTGNTLKLGDVAKVSYKLPAQASIYKFNGQTAIGVEIMKDTHTDSIALKAAVDRKIEQFQKTLPEPLRVEAVVDGPQFIIQQLDGLISNGFSGVLLVLVILFLFLSFRSSLMALWGVPISYLGAILAMNYMGISIDLISIVGLILVGGVLVDDAIIVTENYVENLELGMLPKDAALKAASDLMVPITGTILTTIVAFSPLLLIKSEMSIILRAVPIVIISALVFSWIECFFILPNHLAHFVRLDKPGIRERFLERVKNIYRKVLNFTIRMRYAALAAVIVLFGGSLYIAATKLKHEFDLNISNESVVVYVTLKASDSLEATLEKVKPIEAYAMTLPKDQVHSVSTTIGSFWRDGRSYNGYRFAKVAMTLPPETKYPTKIKKALTEKVSGNIAKFKTADFESLDTAEEKYGGQEKKENIVSVRVNGGNDVEFKKIEDSIIKAGLGAEGILNAIEDKDRYQSAWRFVPNQSALVQYGFTTDSFARQVKGLFVPDELVESRANNEKMYVYTKIVSETPVSFERLANFQVISANGRRVPLKLLGEWKTVQNLNIVNHFNGERSLAIDFKFDPKKTNASKSKKDLDTALATVSPQYPSYSIEVIDANEEEAKSKAWALRIAVICLAAVMLVMAATLGSVSQTFFVAFPIPFGLIGIIWSLYLHNLPLGIMAIIGLVGVIGIAVNDSLVMMDKINRLSAARGARTRETIIEGATSRMRAILITSITTIGGVMPTAYAIGGESGFTQPLAFSMGWGLSFSAALTLLILPALMVVGLDIEALMRRIFSKRPKFSRRLKKIELESVYIDTPYFEPVPADKPEDRNAAFERSP